MALRMEDKNILDHYTDLSVGDVFRRARMSYNLSIPDVSQRTLIRIDVLEAIENNDRNKLPSRVYAIGFVKNYADFLGLDSNKMIYLFKIQVIGEDPAAAKEKSRQRMIAPGMPVGVLAVIGGGALLILLSFVFLAYRFFGGEDDSLESRHSVPAIEQMMRPDLTVTDADSIDIWKRLTLESIAGDGYDGITLPEAGGAAYGDGWHRGGMVIKAMQTTWVKISSATGELLLNRILQGGDVVQMDPDKSYILETTYADALDVYLGGVRAGHLGGDEKDVKEFILSKDALPALLVNGEQQNVAPPKTPQAEDGAPEKPVAPTAPQRADAPSVPGRPSGAAPASPARPGTDTPAPPSAQVPQAGEAPAVQRAAPRRAGE